MLQLQRSESLAEILGVSRWELEAIAADHTSNVKLMQILDVRKLSDPTKKASRDIISIRGEYRRIQIRLQSRLFRKRLHPSPWSHGGIPRRSAVSNARIHLGQRFALKLDVKDFFLSLNSRRVFSFFLIEQKCSPPVASLLTRLCTYEFHLAIGLITSPILADQIFMSCDRRIANLCQEFGLRYSRFVDDLTVSGPYDPRTRSIDKRIEDILWSNALKTNRKKAKLDWVGEEIVVTGVRINRSRLDVPTDYLSELEKSLAAHAALGRGADFDGLFYSSSQLLGRTLHACRLNPSRRRALLTQFRAINWSRVWHQMKIRGLMFTKPILAKRGEAITVLESMRAEASKEAARSKADCRPLD
jgi:RNA-directed DNA polymerase